MIYFCDLHPTPVPPPPEPDQWSIPIRQTQIIPRPVHDPGKSSTSFASTNRIPSLLPNITPVRLLLPFDRFLVGNPFPSSHSSVCTDSFTSCSSDASRTSTVSPGGSKMSNPPYGEGLMAFSPVPHGRWITVRSAYTLDPAPGDTQRCLCASPSPAS